MQAKQLINTKDDFYNLRYTKTEIDNNVTGNYYDKTYINSSLNYKLHAN